MSGEARSARWSREGTGLTSAFFLGSAALLIGERLLAGSSAARFAFTTAACVLVLASFLARTWLALRGPQGSRAANRILAKAHLAGVLAFAVYLASTDEGLRFFGIQWPLSEGMKRLQTVLRCAWPILWLAAACSLALGKRAARPLGTAGTVEERRVYESAASGLSIAFAAAFLFTVNYLVIQHDASVDLSYFRTARPGEGTRDLVTRLADPVEVLLFFPEANEVADELMSYFHELEGVNPLLSVRRADRLLDPDLARKNKVRNDGVVLIQKASAATPAAGEATPPPSPATPAGEQWSVGTEIDSARYKLRKLDEEFRQRLVKVTQKQRIAYVTVGHGEMTSPASGETGAVAKAARLRPFLRQLGFDAKDLGFQDGLASDVPADASLVMVVGPETPFLPAEVDSLARYLDKGGKLFLTLDGNRTGGLEPLLASLGLEFHAGPLANDRYHYRARYNDSDRVFIGTGSYSSHPSVTNLSREARRATFAAMASGYLTKAADAHGNTLDFTVRTLTGTWADANGDFQFNEGVETKDIFNLAATAEREIKPAPGSAAAPGEPAKRMRAIVLADSDAVGDDLLPNGANLVFVGDGLEWLTTDKPASTKVESEEDVPVEHTRDQDTWWFWGVVVGAPLAMLALGWVVLRIRRGNRS